MNVTKSFVSSRKYGTRTIQYLGGSSNYQVSNRTRRASDVGTHRAVGLLEVRLLRTPLAE